MLKKITKLIQQNDKIALFHHINPDGDTLSSSYGLALALKEAFPKKEIKVVANEKELFSFFGKGTTFVFVCPYLHSSPKMLQV